MVFFIHIVSLLNILESTMKMEASGRLCVFMFHNLSLLHLP